MAIRVRDTISGNNRTVIDDTKNFFVNDLTFTDNSSVSSLGLAPGSLKWTLDNPNAFDLSGLDDKFGYTIAASDQYLIVGVPSEDDTGSAESGKAYIFDVRTGALVWTLNNPGSYGSGTGAYDNFGNSVAISGNYAIVGANSEEDAFANSGIAYVYNVTTGQIVHTLNNPNAYSTGTNDAFGTLVAISGNYAIVSATGEDDAGGELSGKAYIFNVTTGTLLWTLDNPNAYSTSASDRFGYKIAISGNYAIVGAYNEDDASGTESGKAYVYNVTTGQLLYTLNNPSAYGTGAGDQFGSAVAISENYIAVGSFRENGSAGVVYIFDVATGTLVRTLSGIGWFGYSVAISGNLVAVGSPVISGQAAGYSGKAYLYDATNGNLIRTIDDNSSNRYLIQGTFDILSINGNAFGGTVSLNSSMLFVGATLFDSNQGGNSGAVYSYNLNNFAPMYTFTNPVDNYDGSSQGSGDYFGQSVAISGNYAIVGASGENSFNTTDVGCAYVFNIKTGELLWTLKNPFDGLLEVGANFGQSVSASGNYCIISAYNEYGKSSGLSNSGRAYVFNITTGQLIWTLNNPNAYGTEINDLFGISVSISGNYAIVGAHQEDDAGGELSGKAYIFNVTTGTLLWTLNNPNAYSTSASDTFGVSVAISDNYAIVGAQNEDDTGATFSGKAYIFNVTTGVLVHTLNNPNAYSTSSSDRFGISVAISGNYAIVSAYLEDDAGGTNSGKVYIFNVTTGALLWALDNPNAYSTSLDDLFGNSVAISGNFAIVGAYQEDDAGGAQSGKAYIFNVTTGQLIWTLDNPNAYGTSENDRFGASVAISDNYAVVSAAQENSFNGTFSGKAYIFNLASPQSYTGFTSLSGLEKLADQNTIVDRSYLKWILDNPNAYSTSANDNFGHSVAISGNYAIVGARYEDDASGTDSGKAYIFNVTTGQLVHTLNNPNAYGTSLNDSFSTSVAISGNYAIVGVHNEDDAGGTGSGKAYIFNVTTGALVHTLNNPNAYSTSAGDQFGVSVAISGNFAIISANVEDDAGGTDSGKAYIFNVTTGALVHTLDNPNAYSTSQSDRFGWTSVAISNNYAIVGAPFEDDAGGTDSGKAYIFNVTTGALVWTLDNPNAYSTSVQDNFGLSVAISGNFAIVGAQNEDQDGGSISGKAYIFNVTTGALVHTLNNPNTYGASSSDTFGYSVAISGDYAIVGANYEDDPGGASSGKAYIFNVTTGALVATLDNPNPYGVTANDLFGSSIAISDNYVIVGVYGEGDTGGTFSGKAYIFSINNLNYKSLEDKLISLFHY